MRKAFGLGVKVAPGSDAGAYRVLHVQGIQDEIAGICADSGK